MVEVAKCKCGSEFGDLMSSLGRRQRFAQNGDEHRSVAKAEFDGSRRSFEIALGNIGAQQALRDYGLTHILPFITKTLPDLFECEHFDATREIRVLHEQEILIRLVNTGDTNSDISVFGLDVCDILRKFEHDIIQVKNGIRQSQWKRFFNKCDYVLHQSREMLKASWPNMLCIGSVGATVGFAALLYLKRA
mmetsp:Transcript_26241/g.43742  ORF Transcript_26241/g.43742 Transcript_26241/m.43742 type:complete len:191 (+) Transcript_26241:1089-1661(+)